MLEIDCVGYTYPCLDSGLLVRSMMGFVDCVGCLDLGHNNHSCCSKTGVCFPTLSYIVQVLEPQKRVRLTGTCPTSIGFLVARDGSQCCCCFTEVLFRKIWTSPFNCFEIEHSAAISPLECLFGISMMTSCCSG
jgi:hypothetical protein